MLKKFVVAVALGLSVTGAAQAQFTKMGADLTEEDREMLRTILPGYPEPKDEELVHIPGTMEDLENTKMHDKLKEAIRYGHEIFTNTQMLRGKYVFNDLNCTNCHLDAGARPFAGPVWPAVVTLPDFRGKNNHVNNFEERMVGCFSYSMNGTPPPYGSDEMVALQAYHQWLAKGVDMYPDAPMYGRGFPRPGKPELEPDHIRGEAVFAANCAICHGEEGQGQHDGHKMVFPPLWGPGTYNWGAGIARVHTLAGFVKYNMPLGASPLLTDQEAWDVAQYVNTRERPQDPRYTGDVIETRALYDKTFHTHTNYGLVVDGVLLGQHDNVGYKDFLKPDALAPRYFGKNPEVSEE